jgi:hypothetical protein
LDIFEGEHYSDETKLHSSMYIPSIPFEINEGTVHKTVGVSVSSVSITDYKLHTDETDAANGGHIRMWVIFDNPIIWLFVDHIDLTIQTQHGKEDPTNIDGYETFRCGKDQSVTGLYTDVIALRVGETEHPFTIDVYFNTETKVDYVDISEIEPGKPMFIFGYDDQDPVLPSNSNSNSEPQGGGN